MSAGRSVQLARLLRAALLAGLLVAPSGWARAQTADTTAPAAEVAQVPQVNLNTATVAELQRLPGVGPARAEAIVAYRERRPFRRVEELMRIRGIGRKTFRRLRPMLTLGNPTGR